MHLHLAHIPHPHVDPHVLAHDALVAAEVALVALTLGVAADRGVARLAAHDTVSATASGAPAASATAPTRVAAAADLPSLDLVEGAAPVTARVHLPDGATGRVAVVDASGSTVAETLLTGASAEVVGLAAGTYTLVLHEEGPLETIGDATVSSAIALRTPAFTVADAATVRVVVDR